MVSPFAPRTFALLLSVSLGLSGHARAFALRQSGLEESPHVREELVEALSSGGILPEDKRLLRRGVSIGQVARFLLVERPWATVVFLPDLGAEKWGFRRVALGSKKRRFSGIREIQRLLWRYESYALHEGGRTEIWVVPQAVLLQESPRERVKEFRSLAQQALRGDQREDGTRRWIALFGGEGGKGLDLRVSPHTGQVHLFGLQLRNRRYRSVNVYFPRRFRNQVVRFVPHVDEQGRLFVRVYRLEPLRFLRDLRWDEDSQWIASITPVRQVLAHEAPGAPNAAGSSQAVEDRDYSVEELQQATGIEPEALRDQGCLYLNAEGRVPAGLVAMITRTAKEINRQEYPVGALPQLLGRDYGTVWERVKQKVAPSEVGQAGRFLTLPREIVLEWVLLPRIREWIGQEVGGLVSRHAAARELGVPAAALQKLKGRAPYLDGVPLWVQFGPKRPFTRGGLDAVHREIRKVLSEVHARGEVVLLHAVRSRYPHVTRTRRSVLLRKAVQAVVELGIPYRELGHPLSEAERWIAVPRARLGELFHEVERKTRRTLRFIHSDRRYSVLAVAEVLRISSQAVFQKIKKNQLKAEPGLEIGKQRIWISGEELLRLVRREQFSKAGLEELAGEANQAIKVALTIVPFRDTALFLTRTGEAFRAVRKIPQGDWAGLSGDFRSLQQQLRAVRVMKDSGQKPAAAELWRALHTFQKRWEAAFELGNTQPVQEASKELFEQFRPLLHQSVAGSPQAREELLRRWGTSGDQGEGVVVRIPRGMGKLYLFGFLRSKGDYTTVLLSFPPRLHARLIRMIPRIEKSRLFLYLHEVEPARLFRSLLWHPDSASFRRIGSLRAEKLRLIAQIPMPANGPRIIESESYPRDSLSRLTGIPEGLLAELEAGGVLYRDPSGGVPGGLVAALALAYRQTDREEYPISALQDLLGKKKREAQRFPARKGFPVIQRAGQERRLSRGIVVKLVLERQARNWIREHVDGFVVVEGEPERALGLPAVVLGEWPDPPPVYVGYPLWVKLNHRRLWTRKGFQGLMEEVNAVSERLSREGKVILLDAVKGKYPGGVGGDLARRYLAAVRAMRELGIDHQVLADHPLAALRTVIAVDGGRLKELFREAEHPTRWKADQIRLDRSYGVPAVARVLGWTQSRLHQRIRYRKRRVQSEQFFGRHFIAGAEVRRLLREQAGLEEGNHWVKQGWEPLAAGSTEGLQQARAAWLRIVGLGKVGLLHRDFEERLKLVERLPGTADFRLPALEKRAFELMQELLADPEAQFAMGRTQIESWRRNFARLAEEFPTRAEESYRLRERWLLVRRLERIGDVAGRLRYLREQAGFRSPHDLEKAAGVAWAVVSRAEEGKRGMGPEAGGRVRRELEKRLLIPLSLSFRFLQLPLERRLNGLSTAQERQEFIQEELLGWSWSRVARSANVLKDPADEPLPSEQVRPADQSRARTRRLIRLALESGLLERFQSPVRLDGYLRVAEPVRDRLAGMAAFQDRLQFLLGEVLVLSSTELLHRAGASSHFSIETFEPAGRRRAYTAWRPILDALQRELRRRGEEFLLDEDLLPVASAGLEEGGINRREFLQSILAAWAEAERGWLSQLLSGSVPTMRDTLSFFVSLTGARETFFAEQFGRSPEEAARTWEQAILHAIEELDPGADPHPDQFSGDAILSRLSKGIAVNQQELEHLRGPEMARQEDLPFKVRPATAFLEGAKGYGNREDLRRYWRALAHRVLGRRTDRLRRARARNTSAAEIVREEQFVQATKIQMKHLEEFSKVPQAVQEQLLEELFRLRVELLESLRNRIEPEILRQFELLKRRSLQRQETLDRQLQPKIQSRQRLLQSLEPHVPPGAVFAALIASGNSARERGFVDDLALVEKIVQEDSMLRGMTVLRERLRLGEDVVEGALRVARGYEVPGRQLTVGIALGVLPEEKAPLLYGAWPKDQIDTQHPLLALSFIYTPAEILETRPRTGSVPVPSFSSQFAAWVNSGTGGIIRDLPGIALPLELWDRFERMLQAQAGLEQAA